MIQAAKCTQITSTMNPPTFRDLYQNGYISETKPIKKKVREKQIALTSDNCLSDRE
jgi:hypothetical protein